MMIQNSEMIPRSNVIKMLISIVIAITVVLTIDSVVYKSLKQEKIDRIRPHMEMLAKNGQPEAMVWLYVNVRRDRSLLTAAAEKGYPKAKYYLGRLDIYEGKASDGNKLIAEAVAAGNEMAVDWYSKQKIN